MVLIFNQGPRKGEILELPKDITIICSAGHSMTAGTKYSGKLPEGIPINKVWRFKEAEEKNV